MCNGWVPVVPVCLWFPARSQRAVALYACLQLEGEAAGSSIMLRHLTVRYGTVLLALVLAVPAHGWLPPVICWDAAASHRPTLRMAGPRSRGVELSACVRPDSVAKGGAEGAVARLCLGLLGACIAASSMAAPAFAERSGTEIFSSKCINCHRGGGNTVVGAQQWTLQSDALQKYGFDDVDKVQTRSMSMTLCLCVSMRLFPLTANTSHTLLASRVPLPPRTDHRPAVQGQENRS